MPLPHSHKKEKKSEFLSRCMSNINIQKDFKDQSQRSAVCYNLFKKKVANASFVIKAGGEEYLITLFDEPNPLQELEKDSNLKKSDISKEPDPKKDKSDNTKPDMKGMYDDEEKQILKYTNTIPPNPVDLTKGEKSVFSPLHDGGLAPNPDNATAPVDRMGQPKISEMQWYMGQNMIISDYGNIEFLAPNNENISEKIKKWYIACIDGIEAKWPLSYEEIEKDFDRPNKNGNPTAQMDKDKTKNLSNTDQIEKDNKQYII